MAPRCREETGSGLMKDGYYRIGELARRTGLTVRALRHYDRVGLLQAVRDRQSGHRFYGPRELERLQRILGLRQLGLPLARIADCLHRPDATLPRVLDAQADRLRLRLRETERILARLDACLATLDRGGKLDAEELLTIIGMTTMYEKHFTDEQLATLNQRRADLGEEIVADAEREWPELIAAMRREMEAGTDPADNRVRPLAERWRMLIHAFSGGDHGLEDSVGRLYRAEPGVAAAHDLDGEVFSYAGKAMAALED